MEKVLFIAYHFAPESDAGVHRSIRFVKLLPEMGYEPIVLTVDEEELQQRGCKIDEQLLKDVPKDTTILRAPSAFDFKRRDELMRKRLFRIAWFTNYQRWWESAAGWTEHAYPIAKKAIEAYGIKIIYTSSAPFAPMEMALRLKKELGVKWVADLRDPYTDAYANIFPSRTHYNRQRRWEKRIFTQADKLIVNTPEVKKLYLARGLAPANGIEVLTNGYLHA